MGEVGHRRFISISGLVEALEVFTAEELRGIETLNTSSTQPRHLGGLGERCALEASGVVASLVHPKPCIPIQFGI